MNAEPTPEQRPEGRLIADALARRVPRMSQREAARRSELSETRWRQIIAGYQQLADGVRAPVVAPAETLARMAAAVGVSVEDLADAGRQDAAEAMLGLAEASMPLAPTARRAEGAHDTGLDESLEVLIARTEMLQEHLDGLREELSYRESIAAEAVRKVEELRYIYHRDMSRLIDMQKLISVTQHQRTLIREALRRDGASD